MGIGKKIKELRLSKGLTQKQLGEKIGRSTESVKKYESGEVTPPHTVLKQIANTLGVSLAELTLSQEELEVIANSISQAGKTLRETLKPIGQQFLQVQQTIAEQIGPVFEQLKELAQEIADHDVRYLLERKEKVYYNGHLLSDEERRRALDMLKVLFPEYQDDEE